MYLNNYVGFRCPKEIYRKLKKAIKGNRDIENMSHAIRIAIIKYTKELENAKVINRL